MAQIKGRVQSVDRAARILKCFSHNRRTMKLTEIAERLAMNKSTVHGLINTLKEHGLIDQDTTTQEYRLGLFLLELGTLVKNSMDVVEIASCHLENVLKEIDETVHLGVLEDMDVVYIDKRESTKSMRIFTEVGSRVGALNTAVGRSLIAYQTESDIMDRIPDDILIAEGTKTLSKEAFEKDLATIRKVGYAIDDEHYQLGLYCIGVPIYNSSGQVRYSMSVSGPKIRMTPEVVKQSISVLQREARMISQKLGYKP